ncbi:centromere protein U [Scomber scombrus]|uniref:centromere protein U n=1 Tax=Scomber scombrus TaxID=13677 RepID=UPI002DD94DC4|nr:centromere protein U [Scomber scombrus]
MSAKKGRKKKMLPAAAEDSQKAPSVDQLDSANLSAIERDSFMKGLQSANDGNPLHSTAMEEDLDVLEEGRVNKGTAGKKNITAKQQGAAVKRKQMEPVVESDHENQQQKKRRSTIGRGKARPDKGGATERKKRASEEERGQSEAEGTETQADPSTATQERNPQTPAGVKRQVGGKPAKRRSVKQKPEARPVKNQQMKDKKRKGESGTSSDPQSQEQSDSDAVQQRRNRVLPSDDDDDKVEDTSWKPTPKKGRGTRKSLSGKSNSRKSSSGSASAEAEKTKRVEVKKKRRRGGTQLEEVLDAFMDFCEQYRETVESRAVKESIDSFSNNVKEQLMEKISSHKDLHVLKRENAKVASLTRTKMQRLLDAKHEMMRAKKQVSLLKKEKAELELRLSDLRRSQSFLCDIRELNRQYLNYRQAHPKEKEKYGASSLPALLVEAKQIQGAERQLRAINNRLEKTLKKNGK